MTVNRDKINIEKDQNYKDFPVLLLSEYADKILTISKQIKVYRNRSDIYLFLFLLLILLIIISSFLILQGIPIAIVFLIPLISTFSRFKRARKEYELKIKYLNSIAQKLERLIRFLSQLQEHVLEGWSNHVELDLRLADAESAIQYHALFLNELNAPFPLTSLFKGCIKMPSILLKWLERSLFGKLR